MLKWLSDDATRLERFRALEPWRGPGGRRPWPPMALRSQTADGLWQYLVLAVVAAEAMLLVPWLFREPPGRLLEGCAMALVVMASKHRCEFLRRVQCEDEDVRDVFFDFLALFEAVHYFQIEARTPQRYVVALGRIEAAQVGARHSLAQLSPGVQDVMLGGFTVILTLTASCAMGCAEEDASKVFFVFLALCEVVQHYQTEARVLHFLEGGLHFLSWECDLASMRPCQLPTSGLVCKLSFVAGEGTTPRGPRSVEASDGQFQWHDVRHVAAGGRLRGVSAAGLVLLVGDATCCALLTPPSSPRPWLG